MTTSTSKANMVDYGLDAPGLVRGFLVGGSAAVVVGVGLLLWGAQLSNWLLISVGIYVGLVSVCFAGTGILMLASSRVGKLHARDRLLDGLHLAGNEQVLDVGCGRGLLLIGAARRLPQGRAVGIDLWSQKDQASNSKAATLANAAAEGVAERVEVQDGDMRSLPFSSASFDAVVSSLAIHNIPDRNGRRTAIKEIVRVLKPGGQVALLDFTQTDEYAADLQAGEMEQVQRSKRSAGMWPPVRVVTGRKAHRNGGR
jgi:SAM-dependent methyltransferase